MTKTLKVAAVLMILVSLASCSEKIIGTWNIASYEESTKGKQGAVLSNIGTITFEKSGNGTKDISYSIMGILMEDKLPFTWTLEENIVTIEGEDSEFSKTWIVMENKRKSQSWKSTDGSSEVHKLKLTK
ncbi:MAG: lipocalin family protein [Bacteroidales bacterium]|nr:lipocalin family protein [Bacteroidales bacterium]